MLKRLIWAAAAALALLAAMSLAFVLAPARDEDLNSVVRLKTAATANAPR